MLFASVATACGQSHTTDAGATARDASTFSDEGATTRDATTFSDAPRARCPFEPSPAHPYGTTVGRSFHPLTLDRCDGGELAFYEDPAFCAAEHRVTLFNLATMWAAPSRTEAPLLESEITTHYAGRGVRVLQVLMQDIMFGDVEPSECMEWVARYGLSNVELFDPEGAAAIYTPDGEIPTNILVDRWGVIRYRQSGVLDVTAVRAEIDAILAEP